MAKPASKERDLIVGLPSVAFLVMGLVLMANLMIGSSRQHLNRYREDADNAMILGDFARARVCYQRILEADPGDAEAQRGLEHCFSGLRQQARQGAAQKSP